MTTHRKQAMRVLAEGPANSADLAIELGVSQRIASAVLCRMYREGRIDRTADTVRLGKSRGGYLYSRKVKQAWMTGELAALRAMAGARPETAARRLNRSVASVSNQAARMGVKLKVRKVTYWRPEVAIRAARLRETGKTYRAISRDTGVPFGTLRTWFCQRASA